MLDCDYDHLRKSSEHSDAILQCSIVNRTPLIKQYIEELEIEYNIPSPLKRTPLLSSSKRSSKKLQVSLRGSAHRKSISNADQKQQEKKLHLVISHQRQSEPLSLAKKDSLEQRQPLITPKFGQYNQYSHFLRSGTYLDSRLASSEMRPAME